MINENKSFNLPTLSKFAILLGIICIYIRSGSPYSLTFQALSLYLYVALSGIIILYGILHSPKEKGDPLLVFLLIVFCITILVTMITAQDFSAYRNYVIQILMCVDAYLILRMFGVSNTVKLWIRSMRVIVICSLCLYVLIKMGLHIFPTLVTSNNQYYTVFLASQLIYDGRISGSFWEPSMYAVFLAFTLLFELLTEEKYGKYKLWITLETIALLLAGSLSSVVFIVLISYVVLYHRIQRKSSKILFISAVIAFVVFFIFAFDSIMDSLYKILPNLFYKFFEKDVSYLTRLNNPIGDLLACWDNPMGVGMVNVEGIVRQYAHNFTGDSRAIIARTSTWSYYFAAFGWVSGLAVNSIWIVGVIRNRRYSLSQNIVILFILLYAFTSITLVSNQMYWILLMIIFFSSSASRNSTMNQSGVLKEKNYG